VRGNVDNLDGQSSSGLVEDNVSEKEGLGSSALEIGGMGLDFLGGLLLCKDTVGGCAEYLCCWSDKTHNPYGRVAVNCVAACY
jgi:hypothetical protein